MSRTNCAAYHFHHYKNSLCVVGFSKGFLRYYDACEKLNKR